MHLSELTGGMQKRTSFRHFLQLLGDPRLFPSFVSCVESRDSRSSRTIHIRLTFQETGAASSIGGSLSSTSLQKCQRSFACFPQFSQHLFLRVQQAGIQRNRRFASDDPALHHPHWEVNRFRNGIGFGSFCVTRSAQPIIVRSTITRCATSSAADHASAFGFAFHCSARTDSAA